MPRPPLLLETFEDRILCSASPNVTVSAPAKPLIGNKIPVTVTFDNAAGTNAGFGPYVDLVLDHKTGVTGTGGGVDFVVGSDTAKYLGQPVTVTKLTFQAADGAHPLGPYAIHPYAEDTSGNPLTVYAPAGYGVGDTLLVLQLPFGSFTPTQPTATVDLDLTVSNLAELNKPLGISARGGFQFGNDALDNPTTDPSIVGAYNNTSVTPALMTVTNTYLGPEDETATGPNFIRQEQIDVNIAPGQTVTNLQLSDLLPADMQFVSGTQVLVHGVATGAFTTTSQPSTTTPGGTLTETLTGGVTGAGTGTPDATLIFSYYIPRINSGSAVIVNANSGAPNTATDTANASGQWNPTDAGDPQNVAATAGPATHTLAVKSIATQETVAIQNDTGTPGATPGDTLEYTVQVQVSDYFALQNLDISDIISDGQRLDPTFTPTLTWTEHGQTFTAQAFQPGDYTVTPHYSSPGDGNPNDGTDGTTGLDFNISAEMAARGQSPNLLGGGIPNGGTGAGPLPNNPPLPFGPTTVTLKFRTVIQSTFSDNYPSGDAQLDPRDVLNSSVTASGGVLQVNNVATPTGQTASDTSGASVAIVNSSVSKTIYAINGSTNLAPFIGPSGQYLLKPGDTVTYRLDYSLPTGSVENLSLTDFLPEPVFNATQVTTFDDLISAVAPVAGHAQFGPNETLRAVHGAPPSLASDGSANSLVFNYGTTDNPAETAKTVDLLFTVTVGSQPFADGLFLTNQVQGQENNTQLPATKITSDAIVQFQLQEPNVAIYKGIVGYNATGLTLGGIAFTAPTAGSSFTGTVNNAAQAAAIGASDLTGAAGVEGGDTVRYGLVAQNTGRNDAFNVQFGDVVPAGYMIPASVAAMNLTLRRGDGTLLVNGVDYTATLSAGGALSVTLTDNYTGGNVGSDTEAGSLSRGFNADTGAAIANGSNTVVATYDLTLAPGVAQAGSTITNTATLGNYADEPGGPNFVPNGETDSASVTIPRPTLTKVLTGTQFNTTGNSNTQAVIGELVTYTLTLTVPDGSTPNAVLNDTLDPGLAFVDVQSVALSGGLISSNTVGTGTAPANVTVTSTGHNLAFNFGTLTNSDPGGTPQTITIVYQAVALNENSDSRNATGNQAGVQLANSASLAAQFTDVPAGSPTAYNVAQTAATGKVTVVEPVLTLANGASTTVGGPYVASLTGVDGGDPVFYKVTIANAANNATAFNTTLSDALPAFLTGAAIQSVAGGGFTTADFTISGGTLQTASASGIDITGGTTVTVIVQGTLSATIPSQQIVTDTANIQWTSLSGTPGQISTYNAASTERTGTGGVGTDAAVLNNYAVAATATVTATKPVVDKRFAGGSASASDFSVPAAGANPLGDVVAGESVLYDILVTLPEGVTQNLKVKDLVPAGMRLDTTFNGNTGYQIITSAAASNGQLGADFSNPGALGTPALTTLGGTLGTDGVGGSLSFGNITVNADNVTNNNSFLIRVRGIVDDVIGNQAGTTLNNVAQITLTNPNTSGTTTVADPTPNDHTVTVIEPTLTITKNVSSPSGDAGNPITYTVTFSNPNIAGNADAYDVTLSDTLDDAVTSPTILTGANFTATGFSGAFTAPTASDFQIVNVGGHNVVQLNPASTLNMPLGSSVTLEISGTLAATVQPGQQINNTARTFWTSTDGANPDKRDGSNVQNTTLGTPDPTQLNNYGVASPTVVTTVAQPVVSGSIFATSEPSTPDNFNTGLHDVAPGEIVTYRVTVDLPEGVTPAFSILDAIPAGLAYVPGSVQLFPEHPSSPDPALNAAQPGTGSEAFNGTGLAAPTVSAVGGGTFTNGTGVQFNFASVTTTGDNDINNNTFYFTYQAVVLDVPGNTGLQGAQTTGANAVTYSVNNGPNTAALVDPSGETTTLIEPHLGVNKTVTINGGGTSGDAGDTVNYTAVISHQSNSLAEAFNTTFSDPLPPEIATPASFTVTDSVLGDISNLFDISGGVLETKPGQFFNVALGETVTIAFTSTLTSAVTPNETIDSTASIAYTGLPGVKTPPTYDPSPDVTTDHDRSYAASDNGPVTVPVATISKSLFATSEPSTAGSNVTIGETATYALKITLPEGTTPNLSVLDSLPTGMQYLSSSIVTTAAASGGLLAEDFNGTVPAPTVTGGSSDGAAVTFSFGSTGVAGDNDPSNNSFLILVTARVLNDAGNVGTNPPGQTVLPNTATLSVPVEGLPSVTTPPVNVTVVEPKLAITKTFSTHSGDAGDTVTVTLSVTNSGTSNAYNVDVTDPFPAGQFTNYTAGTTPAGFTFANAGDTVSFTGGAVNAGQTLNFIFTAQLSANVTPNELLANTASVTQATTLPAIVAGERYEPVVSGSDTLSIPVATFSKQLFATSDPNTSGSNVEIGETVTYALKVTLPEGTTPSLTATDNLPAGLQYVSSSIVTTAAASGGLLAKDFGGTVSAPAISGGATVTYTFGSISTTGDNDPSNNSFLILVTARVADVPGNVGTTPGQTTLANTATFTIPGEPVSTTPAVNATVVEPRLQIAKSVNDTTPDIGETLNYTLAISHSASSTAVAYDVIVRDAMPAGLSLDPSSIQINGSAIGSSPLVAAGSNNSTASLLDFRLTSLALGGTVTITYNATVAQTQSLAGTNLDNNARIYWDSQPTNNDNNSVLTGVPPGTTERDYGATPGYTEAPTPAPNDPAQDTQRVSVSASAITGTVYQDANADGVFDAGDTGIAGVSLTLTGTDLNGNAFSQTTTSGAGGAYSFTGLPAGVYTITETQPGAYTDGIETVGSNFGGAKSNAFGSDTISGLGIASHANVTGAGYNFGELLPSSISGSVYSDVNNDGIREGGETGIANVPVRLTGTDVYGQSVTLNGFSDAGGNYTFNNGGTGLRPGTYVVTEVSQPVGYLDGRETVGTSGGNGTAVNDQISAIPLAQNTAATNYNFGELNPSSLSGFVYQDLNNNGVREAGESGIQGVAITLTGTNDLGQAVSLSTTTDATGVYSFTNLRPGTYAISEAQPAGYTSGTNAVGSGLSAPNTPGTVSGDTITSIGIANVSPGNNAGTEYDFGEIFAPQLTKSIVSTSEAFTTGNDVAIGETVRYRIIAQIPQSTFRDLVISDLLPGGLGYLNDGTASYAFVSTSAGAMTSASTPDAPAVSTTGAAYIAGNETTVNTITPGAPLGASNISSDLANTAQTYTSGGNVYFHLGTVQNSGGEADQQFVVIEFNALVLNQTSNQAGATLGNGAQILFDTNNDGVTTSADTPGKTLAQGAGPQAVVVEPNLTISKTATTLANPVDAGDTITYQITVKNNAAAVFGADAADAFDVRVQDILDAISAGNPTVELTLANPATDISVSAPGYATVTNNSTNTGVDLTLSQLDVGDIATITVNATVKANATAGSTIANSATATYASLPSAADAPGTAGSATGERTGGDVPSPVDNTPPSNSAILDNYAVGASAANRAVATPAIVKTLVSTSEAATTGGNLAIGETATYALTITLPEGTTPNTTVVDALPAGLQYVSSSADFTSSGVSPFILPAPTVSGGNITWNLGTLTNAADNNPANNSFTILVVAQAADIPANTGGVALRNDASLTYTNGTTGAATVSTSPGSDPVVTIVEPQLQIAKSVDDATPDINQALHYTLTITNPAGPNAADGFNIIVRDLIPSGLTLDMASIEINGVAIGSSPLVEGGASNSTANLLNVQLTQLAVGGTITITYGATVNNTLANTGTTQDNNARIYWDSLAANDGDNSVLTGVPNPSGERDYGAIPGYTEAPVPVLNDPAQATAQIVVNTNAINGTVYDDNNADGQFDAGDTGIGNVSLRLTGTTASGLAVDLTTTSAGDGSYSFGNLPPGTYLITETQPAGYVDGLETAGTSTTTFGGTKSDALDSNSISAITIPAQSNATEPSYNFGETLPSSVAGSTYLDADNNGIRNAGETGLANVPITLTGTDAYGQTVTLSGATDSNGNYSFTGLRPSNGAGYTVTEDDSALVPGTYLDGKVTPGSLGGIRGGAAPHFNVSDIVTPQGTSATGYNFAELVPATLSGSVYVDTNGNGVRDPGEAGIANTTITLTGVDDLGNTVNTTALTDAAGGFSFAGLRPGEYTLTETQPPGYGDGADALGTLGGTLGNDVLSNIAVPPGADGAGYTFGEKSTSISGVVFLDANANGVLDGTETGRLGGVQIQLLDSLNNVVATTTTAADGSYGFSGLTTGDYSVVETQPAGYGTSTPTDVPVTVPAAGVTGVDFGETTGSLAGTVYFDANHNNTLDAGDSGIGGVVLTLTGTDANGLAVSRTATTGANGAFAFTGLLAGNYSINETQPANYSSATNSPGTAGGSVAGDTIGGIALGAAQGATQYNFGEIVSVPPGKGAIAGTVFLDANKDGVLDGGETGIGGVTLTLRDSIGNVLATTTSAADGTYTFGNLAPGNYTIQDTQPPAYGASTPNTLTPISVTANNLAANENFGETYGSLAGFVYVDANNNGAKDTGEAPIAGVTVTLTGTDVNGASVNRATVTKADGSYLFDQLLTGIYTITETQPAQYANGKDALGTAGGTLGTDVTSNIGLGGGIDATSYDFGELPAALSGRVFLDANKNGALDGGESGLGGVTLQLRDAANTVIATTTTAADGSYSFGGLAAGNYTVLETQPNGYGSSTPNSLAVTLPSGGLSNENFGETTASLAGRVYVDTDNSGSFTPGDGNLGGVTVSLTGTDSNNAPINLTTTTGADGAYLFSGLLAGDYTVTAAQPAGYTPASDNVGTAGGQNTAANRFTTVGLGGGIDATGYNFGQTLITAPGTGAVSGVVFVDANKNGVLDGGEKGVGGSVIELLDSGGTVIGSTATNADGTYLFNNVAPGTGYQVTQISGAAGYGTSTPATLSNIAVVAGQAAANNNFGETTGSLAGAVYRDDNNSGAQDAGEPGLAGVIVTLTGTDANGPITPMTTTTDANGHYEFTGLLTGGSFTITETQPAGYGNGKDSLGDASLAAGDDTTVHDTTSGIQIAAAQDASGYNYGELGATVTGTVFSDLNRDGVLETGEPGLGSVPLELLNGSGGIVGTTASAADGTYAFTGLVAGNYTVVETQPAAFGANSPATVPVAVPAGGTNTVNFAEITGSISGTVYHDRNDNGLIDAGEPLLAGVTVTLSGQDVNGNAITPRSTVSAADGSFSFTGLLAGTYTLTETQPAAYGEGRDTVGSAGGNPTLQDVVSGIGIGGGRSESGYLFGERIPSDLVTTKTDNTTSVTPGQVVTYTVTVSNVSLQQAEAVIVTDQFPKDVLQFVSASDGGIYDPVAGTITWRLGQMPTTGPNNGPITLSITALVINPVPAHAETVTNTVSAIDTGSVGPDPTPGNNTATDVDTLRAAPDLYVFKKESLTGAIVGQQITYTITGGNAGNQIATGVIVTDTLPPGLEFVSASNGGRLVDGRVVWQIGTLKPGDTFVRSVTVVVVSVPQGGQATNTVAINDDTNAFEDPTPFNNRSSVTATLSPAFTFAFDAFNNFSVQYQKPGPYFQYLTSPDVTRAALLPLAPIYSGEADPGATLVISLYDAQGNNIGSQTVVVDTGGNWMASFPSSNLRDIPESVQIVEQSAFYSLGDTVGFNLRAYFSPALNPGEFVLGSSGGNGIGSEPAPLLNGIGLENPLQLGTVKYGGEFLSTQATAGGE